MADGAGCTCNALCESECGCGADWTTQEVYDLRKLLEDRMSGETSTARLEEVETENRRLTAQVELLKEDLKNAREENMALRVDIRRLMERRFAS